MSISNMLASNSFAIDLGNNNTLITDEKNILLAEPSCIVFDKHSHSVKAVGQEAYNIFEKNPDDVLPVKPMKWGVIADYDSTYAMVRALVKRVFPKPQLLTRYNNVLSGIPSATTEVERRALRDTLDQFNARKRNLVEEPLAAAIGMGLNIREPDGKMIMDIGGGITEIVIISLSGIASIQSIKTAGDTFTEDIRDHLRKEYNLQVGWKTAEQIKQEIGGVWPAAGQKTESVFVRGKDIREGLPVRREISYAEVSQMLESSMRSIEHHLLQTLETCPPELAADIYGNGIHVTGGGSLLRGLKPRLEKTLQLPVHLDPDPLLSVGKGISTILRDTKRYASILI